MHAEFVISDLVDQIDSSNNAFVDGNCFWNVSVMMMTSHIQPLWKSLI